MVATALAGVPARRCAGPILLGRLVRPAAITTNDVFGRIRLCDRAVDNSAPAHGTNAFRTFLAMKSQPAEPGRPALSVVTSNK